MIREIEISKRFPFIDRASTCCLLRTPIGYRQDGDLFGNRRGGNGGGKLGVLCSCSVSVQVSPYLRERRCERIEVFSSVSSSPPSPLRFTYPTISNGKEFLSLSGFLSEARFFLQLGRWGRRSRNRRARQWSEGREKGFSLPGGCRAVGQRATTAVCREKVWRRRGGRREGSFVASRDARKEAEGHGGGGLGRAISIVGREHRSRSPI